MLTKRIIPCLDVKDGRVVKGVKFLDLKDAGDPAEVARVYDKEEADEIIFLDITASFENRKTMLDAVKRTAETVFMPLTVGGGIRSLDCIRDLMNAGTDKVSINTGAVKDPDFVRKASERFGSQCIVVAIDAKRLISSKSPKWEIYINGGKTPTGIDALEWGEKVASLGAGEILLTSMDKDGTKEGYDIHLTRSLATTTKLPVIASGGAGTLEHFYEAVSSGSASAVLGASVFHFGIFTIRQVKEYLKQKDIPVKL